MAKRNASTSSTSTTQVAPAVETETTTPVEGGEEQQQEETTGEEEPTEENTAPEAPVEETPAVAQPVTTSETPEVIADDVTKQAPAPVVEATVIADPVPAAAPLSTDPVEGDDENVEKLKLMLAALKAKLGGYGKDPENFKIAAKQASTVTKFVISHPKTNVLDTLLAFFNENKDGVCAAENFMKGSTTLPATEEQQLGFLFNLFSDLANKRLVGVNASLVINVLKKPEIVNYFQRKVAGLKAAKG